MLGLSNPSSISFECYAYPDRGWNTNFSYVWLSSYSGQGGQEQDLYVDEFETQWSGITPGLSDYAAACLVALKMMGGITAGYDRRETSINLCPSARYGAGDPIDTHSGAFNYGLLDLSMSTSAGPLTFQRYYSSQLAGSSGSTLGHGWTHNQDTHLTFGTSTTGTLVDVYFKAETGNEYRFRANSDGTFSSYPGVFATLTQDPGPPVSYTLVDSHQNTYQFDDQGRVVSWTNTTGQAFTYTYDTSGLLTSGGRPNWPPVSRPGV